MSIFEFLEQLSWPVGSAAVVSTMVLCTILGVLVIRKFVHPSVLKSHHDVAGYVFTNLGVLYAVLLGFIVVNVHTRYLKINETAELEASYLSQLYRDAEVFTETQRTAIRSSIKAYGESIANSEWAVMTEGTTSPLTEKALNNLWNSYYQITPTTMAQNAWYTQSITVLNNLMEARLSRLIASTGYLGPQMWFLLILGGIIMVCFIWFFSVESLTSHLLLASVMAAITAFLLFLIYSLDTAFTGSTKVIPEAITRGLMLMG